MSDIVDEETPELSREEQIKQRRLETLAVARQKAHEILKQRRAEKEKAVELLTKQKKAEEEKKLEKKANNRIKREKEEVLQQEVLEKQKQVVELIGKKIQKMSAPPQEPTPPIPIKDSKKKKKARVIVVESDSYDSDSSNEPIIIRKPRRKTIKETAPAPPTPVQKPLDTLTRDQIRQDLNKMKFDLLYKSLWN